MICSGETFNIGLTTSITGATVTYSWTTSVSGSVSGASGGTGNTISQTLTNNSDEIGVVTYIITPYIGDCSGTAVTATVTVAPRGKVTPLNNITYCHNEVTPITTFSTSIANGTVTYAWTNSNTNIGLVSSGITEIPSFTAKNANSAPIHGTIKVTPTNNYSEGANSVTCVGQPMNFNIFVNPLGQVNPISDLTVCDADHAVVNFSTTSTGGTTTYAWEHTNTTIGLATPGSGNISFTATNIENNQINSVFTVTPTFIYNDKTVVVILKTLPFMLIQEER